ncbi:MAG: hypothetical protein AB7L91_00235 [Dehalococcoidia bacterium]
MQWRLRSVLIASIVAMAIVACGGEDEPGDPAAWATGMCTAQQTFLTAIIESRDDLDPTALELGERKERAARLGDIEAAAARQLADDLEGLNPPEGAEEYHKALVQQAKDTAKAVETQVAAIEKATTAQQIAVANAEAQFETRGAAQEVQASAVSLSDDLVDVLLSQEACGRAPIPGEPEQPEPTPAA